jgi:peptide/nickel transport system substrate-binding protein
MSCKSKFDRRLWGAGLLAVLILTAALGGCGGSNGNSDATTSQSSFYTGGTPGGTPVRGGTATIVHPQAILSLDPPKLVQTDEIAAAQSVFDQLFEYEAGQREPKPALASSYTMSNSGLEYVFKIRPDVEFSNGEPLTADDVAFSLQRMTEPIGAGGIGRVLTSRWKSVSVKAPLEVKLVLSKPQPSLVGELGLGATSIVPKDVVESESQEDFAHHPVGTGPFQVDSASPDYSLITMSRNPHYWRAPEPYLDGLVYKTVEDGNSRILAVRSGSATVANGISFGQVDSLKSAPGVRMLVQPLQNALPVFINNAKAPLNEVNVRRALNFATPRKEIIEAVFKGLGNPSNDPVGRLQYWDPKVPTYPYDLAKARDLLKKSSVPNGFQVTIELTSGEPDSALVATILQQAWAQLGIKVEIRTVDSATFFADLFGSKVEVALVSDEAFVTEQYPDDLTYTINFNYPDSGTHADGTNYKSPRAIALMRKATTTQDESARSALFSELQSLLYWEDPPIISIADLPSRTLVDANLRGFEVLQTNRVHMEKAWLEK